MCWALSTLGLTYPAEDDFYVEAFVVKIGLANLAYTMNRAVWLTASRTRTA